MSIITFILSFSFLVNPSLLFPTEHQLTTYGVNNDSSTSHLTTKSTTWSTPEANFSVNCTCSINTTNSWITYPESIPTISFCNSVTDEDCFQACASMVDRTIFNVQSESASLNITNGVGLSDYLCGLMAKGVSSPCIVLSSKMDCIDKSSASSSSTSHCISLPMDYNCRLIGNDAVNSTLKINEMTTIS